jgi:hypothetical protein
MRVCGHFGGAGPHRDPTGTVFTPPRQAFRDVRPQFGGRRNGETAGGRREESHRGRAQQDVQDPRGVRRSNLLLQALAR